MSNMALLLKFPTVGFIVANIVWTGAYRKYIKFQILYNKKSKTDCDQNWKIIQKKRIEKKKFVDGV